MDDLQIVCYTGGACGDLLTALIDPTDIGLAGTRISHASERQKLKKHFLFADADAKDQYLREIGHRYKSIPSHDIDYHNLRKHKFISITVTEFARAQWAAGRFRDLHRPHVWEEMMRACGAQTVDDYAQIMIDYSRMVMNQASIIVKLEDICAGLAIDVLCEALGRDLPPASQHLYNQWLQAQQQMAYYQ